MKILALDCSTEACSVALLSDQCGGLEQPSRAVEILEYTEQAARSHTQRLLPMVEQLLADAETSLHQLDAIAFGRGPGSFTGLRICLGAVQGLAFGADLPVVPISSLAAQAQSVFKLHADLSAQDYILSTLDARMDEVYWAIYQQDGATIKLVEKEHISAPEKISTATLSAANILPIGSGINYRDRIPAANQYQLWLGDLYPRASSIAELAVIALSRGQSCSAAEAVPTYLRDEVAWQKQPLANV